MSCDKEVFSEVNAVRASPKYLISVIIERSSPELSIDSNDDTEEPSRVTTKGPDASLIEGEQACSQQESSTRSANQLAAKRKAMCCAKRCNMCKNCFKNFDELKVHLDSHIDEKSFRCVICDGYTSSNWAEIKAHMKAHNPQEAHKCTVCGDSFRSSYALRNHWRFHHLGGTHLCEVCGFEAPSKYALVQHGIKCHSDAHNCQLCSYTSDNQIDLDEHKRLRHENRYACKFCYHEQPFASQHDLQLHMNEDHPGKICYVCDRCNYVAKLRHHLAKHYLIHTGERPLKCKVKGCLFSSRDFRNLKQHVATKHGKPGDLACRRCYFVTNCQNDYDVHMAMHHIKVLRCKDCNFQANSTSSLRRHRLAKHVHPDDMRYPCPHCSYKTNFRESMNKHLLTHILRNNRHRCAICREDFDDQSVLKEHISAAHPSVLHRVLFCSVCAYSCMKRRALQHHAATHSDEKPHKCEACTYRSKTAVALRAHVLRKHPASKGTT